MEWLGTREPLLCKEEWNSGINGSIARLLEDTMANEWIDSSMEIDQPLIILAK